jgi:hypothetical protein
MKEPSMTLSAEQVQATMEALGLSHQEFAAQVGCGASQMWKYQKEGLPPRMNRAVKAAILEAAESVGVLVSNAQLRETRRKLASHD